MTLYLWAFRPYDSPMTNQQIDPSMLPISAIFDLCAGDLLRISRASEARPCFICEIKDTKIEVGFYTNEDAIAFTSVYLGRPSDSVYVAEYLGFDWKEMLPAT